jgi:hypothetical protein
MKGTATLDTSDWTTLGKKCFLTLLLKKRNYQLRESILDKT